MDSLWWVITSLIVGVIVGGLARLLVPGRDPMGCFMTALLGIAGSFLGGFIATLLWGRGEGFQTGGFVLSLIGAVLLLLLWRQFRRT
jgi:uncharacterized membrane protein YeaQ/YmgE (transglycosylase-associated protein family)